MARMCLYSIVLADLNRDANGDLTEMGTDRTVHMLETISCVGNSCSSTNESIGVIQDLEDIVVGQNVLKRDQIDHGCSREQLTIAFLWMRCVR